MLADDIARAELLRGDGPLRKRWRRRGFWVGICIGGVAVVMGTAVVLPCAVPARTTALRNACTSNLRAIHGAKEQWVMLERKGAGAVPTEEDIYGGAHPLVRSRLSCPSDGVYRMGTVGEMPTCSLKAKGHRLN
jgi:hypothetical protein